MVRFPVWPFSCALRPRALLVAEDLCLRQQLLLLQRRHPQPRLRMRTDRNGSIGGVFAYKGVLQTPRTSLINSLAIRGRAFWMPVYFTTGASINCCTPAWTRPRIASSRRFRASASAPPSVA